MHRVAWVAVVVTAVVGADSLAGVARAQSDDATAPTAQSPTTEGVASDEYRRLVGEAIVEFDERNFDEALTLFEQAYAMRASARVLRGIGKVRFEQRQYVRALEAFEQALAATLDPLTEEMRAEVEELRQRSARYVGELRIVVVPHLAVVTLDGRELAPDTHYPVRLDVGAHLVGASAEGHQPATRTVDVVGGQTTEVMLDLVAQRAGVVVVQESAPDTTGVWVTAGIGVALVGATVGSAIWMANRLDASSRCRDAQARGVTCVTSSSVTTERDGAIGTVVVSSVLTAAAVVSFVVLLASAGRPSDSRVPTIACAATPDSALCTVGAEW